MERVVVEGRVEETVVGTVGNAGEGRGRDDQVVAAVKGATVGIGG